MKKRIALHLLMLAGAVAIFTATAMAKLLPDVAPPSVAVQPAP